MRFSHAPADEYIDQLCQRECCFVICRKAGALDDEFFMQQDGQCSEYFAGQALEASCFIIAPFNEQECGCCIREERYELPDVTQFQLLKGAVQVEQESNLAQRMRYEKHFRRYHQELLSGSGIKKLVLARSEDIAIEDSSAVRAYREACASNPRCFCTLMHHPKLGTWVGATPELLLKGKGKHWESMALAGTQARGGEWNLKNREEHEWVCQHNEQIFVRLGVEYERGATEALLVGNIEHLCTGFYLKMGEDQLGRILSTLPPTPAVCGYPVRAAREFMLREPDFNRGCYAGFMGFYRAGLGGEFYVTLRCMRRVKGGWRLYAGGGIMPESEVNEEWVETCLKLGAMERVVKASGRVKN